ncbi:3-hydroxyacyl-CoA dehydrogenase [Arthrobacter crystallopoietes]|uniref:3-hydroxyacyl-CoA dehydrogenase n=2 Tax=Crystallibacter crystallopoietes TaxID=37928 RepID=A0A1H1CUP0_9MICC|nr:3-hydroxybutyryl-CoA dehydrogenase [Arthrobacter crystallopoietes]SDQ67882.1 3-hydroxyacyl-CoA dehydrogenase [Arthrobacter crystallopoietes]
MGAGIAQIAVQAGMTVRLYDTDSAAVARGRDQISRGLERLVAKDRLGRNELDAAMDRVLPTDDLSQVARADAVIEAVIERLEVKQEVFSTLSAEANDSTLLATNTSAISISEIAGPATRPQQIIGMHFFSPVPVMALCEIIRGYQTSDKTLEAALGLAADLGKQSIVVNRDDAGFVTSRLMTVLMHEAVRLVEQGLASPEDVDRACELGFGHRMGPLATADLTGVDVAYRAGRAIFEGTGDPTFRSPQLLRRMVASGHLGRKSGRGFYKYEGTK